MRSDLRTAAGLLAVVVVLAVTVLGAAVDVPWDFQERGRWPEPADVESEPPPMMPQGEQDGPERAEPPEPLDLSWVRWVGWAVVAGAVLFALARLVFWLAERATPRRRLRASAATAVDVPEDPELPVLQRGVAEAQRFLREVVGASDAIVAAWLALEDAAAASGVPRQPAQTPTEFTVEVLARTDADTEATQALLGLYHRARFSGRQVERADVERAAEAFGRIATSWDAVATADHRASNGDTS